MNRKTLVTTITLMLFTQPLWGAPFPSWQKGDSRTAIMDFVARVTSPGKDFVAQAKRIAVFDNDGTLWSEQPVYFQLLFSIDRVKAMAKADPALAKQWQTEAPFDWILASDGVEDVTGVGGKSALATVLSKVLSNQEHVFQLFMATHAGLSQAKYRALVLAWIQTAKHPITGKKYTDMVYQPMLEVLQYLRAQGFKTYIVSGGGIDFMRPWVEGVYGIPPEQVIGTRFKKSFSLVDGKPVIQRLPEIDFMNDKGGKPIGIDTHIGKRPIAAFGNSDGDLPMLQYTAAGEGARLLVYVHHTDAKREWAYDRESTIGRLDKGLDEARQKRWTVVDMQNDWSVIYPDR